MPPSNHRIPPLPTHPKFIHKSHTSISSTPLCVDRSDETHAIAARKAEKMESLRQAFGFSKVGAVPVDPGFSQLIPRFLSDLETKI